MQKMRAYRCSDKKIRINVLQTVLQRSCTLGRFQKVFVIIMRFDLLSDMMSGIKNGDNVGKKEVVIPASKLLRDVLKVLQKHEFVGNFEFVDDGRGGKFKIQLKGSVNNCGAIRPRFATRIDEFEKFEHRFLPAAGFGLLIVSTSKGVMTHDDAKKHKIGGKLLAYVY